MFKQTDRQNLLHVYILPALFSLNPSSPSAGSGVGGSGAGGDSGASVSPPSVSPQTRADRYSVAARCRVRFAPWLAAGCLKFGG